MAYNALDLPRESNTMRRHRSRSRPNIEHNNDSSEGAGTLSLRADSLANDANDCPVVCEEEDSPSTYKNYRIIFAYGKVF